MYVFDDGNSRIVKLDPRGKFIAEFGQAHSGAGAVRPGGLNDSIAVDEDENIYVSDPGTPRILIQFGRSIPAKRTLHVLIEPDI